MKTVFYILLFYSITGGLASDWRNVEFNFSAQNPYGSTFYVNGTATLTCQHSNYSPSNLSIGRPYKKQPLQAQVDGRALVYHIENIQCKDRGTYVCWYNNDNAKRTTTEIGIESCAPRLCHEEAEVKTIYSELHENVTFSVCFVVHETRLWVDVFRNDDVGNPMPLERFKRWPTSSQRQGQDLHSDVQIHMYNIKEEDYGNLTLSFWNPISQVERLEYRVILKKPSPPRLCPGETDVKTIYSELREDITFSFCVVTHKTRFSLDVFRDGDVNTSLPSGRFHWFAFLRQNQHVDIYIKVYNIKKKDYGTFIFSLLNSNSLVEKLDYRIILKKPSPPRLCRRKDKVKTIYTELHSDVTLSFCVKSSSEVFMSGLKANNKTQTVPRHSVSSKRRRGVKNKVKIKMFDIQEDDFGAFTLQLFTLGSKEDKMQYVFVLKKTVLNFTLVKSNNSHRVLNESLTLSCESNAHHPSPLTITALDRNLQMRTDVQNNTLQYHIARLQCEDMGTYICHYDNNTNHWMSLTVSVQECVPVCPVDIKVTSAGTDYITLDWDPELDHDDNLRFYVYFTEDEKVDAWNMIGYGLNKTNVEVTGLKEDTFYRFRLVALNKYGDSSIIKDETCDKNTKQVKTAVPECPHDIQVIRKGVDYVSLSWYLDQLEETNSSFYVYMSKETTDDKWTKYLDVVHDTSVEVTELEENTSYKFKVVSLKNYRDVGRINVNVCSNTIPVHTENVQKDCPVTDIQTSESVPSVALTILISTVVSVVVVSVAATVCVIAFLRMAISARGRPTAMTADSTAANHHDVSVFNQVYSEDAAGNKGEECDSLTASGLGGTSGRYVTDDGLVYTTIAHANKKGRQKPKQVKEKNDNVTYATIDFEKTAQRARRGKKKNKQFRGQGHEDHIYVNVKHV